MAVQGCGAEMGTKPASVRLGGMRFRYSIVLAGVVMLAASCSRGVAPVLRGSASTAQGSPSATVPQGIDPVQTGSQLLEAGGRRWLETPVAVVTQEMSYAEAHKWIPMLSEDGDQYWGSQTRVWFVVFKGSWIPTDAGQANAQPVTYPGCLMVLFRASDGSLIAAGDSLCPGQQ